VRTLPFFFIFGKCVSGRAVCKAVSRRPLIAGAKILSQESPFGICGGGSGSWDRFFPNYLRLSRQYHATNAAYFLI